ncbi:MAG: DUF853 family protein [Calditrichaeota bacterium]|nr:MAG: DUF853 family protein [Calditrichota bacterium]
MNTSEQFNQLMQKGYAFKGDAIVLGGAMLDGECAPQARVAVPLKTLNRHGLIAGATGTGKTKTLQLMAEGLSEKGVPSLLMDIKGDLSGLARPGKHHPKIAERHARIGLPYEPRPFQTEFLSLSEEKGVRLRATVSEFGPILFSKILGLNDTQSGIVAVVFKYCDDAGLPLLDLKDFKKVLQFLAGEGKAQIEETYGRLSKASIGTILRKVLELEQQGADRFFGEKSFEVEDLLRTDDQGCGVISILRLADIQDRPKLFSTFMLSVLAEIYSTFPEAGDLDKPRLAIFFDEAHLIFEKASDALLSQIETIVKLVRSKGVGIFFCTQNPTDIPDAILSQLGLKVQHALRAFTAKDRKALKLAAENYPISPFYDTAELLTNLGIGEAAVTALNEKGIPTPLAATLLRAPRSRMGILTPQELDACLVSSSLAPKYNRAIDRESAYELLNAKIEEFRQQATQPKGGGRSGGKTARPAKGSLETFVDSPLVRQIGRTVARELTRGLLGVLGLGGRSRRSKKGWF